VTGEAEKQRGGSWKRASDRNTAFSAAVGFRALGGHTRRFAPHCKEGREVDLLDLFENDEDVTEYSTGEVVFAEGDPGDVMYVVLEGEVDIQVQGQSIYKAQPGELVGEMALIDSGPRSASAVAVTQSKLAPVGEKQFVFMVQQTPFFALHVMRVLVDRLRRMDAKV
jgi:CRP/FNR family cyclic AMP-dependent transcriptional regulator